MSRQGTPSPSNAKPNAASAPSRPVSIPSTAIAPKAAQTLEGKPSVEAVRVRAFEIYQDRTKTGKPGTQQSDWAQAELDLSQKR